MQQMGISFHICDVINNAGWLIKQLIFTDINHKITIHALNTVLANNK
jgi:hypothetical protein